MTDAAAEQPVHRIVFPDAATPSGADGLYLRAEGGHEVIDRTALRLEPGATASFDTYFGAFPRVAWIGRSPLDRLALRLTAEGEMRVRIRGTDEQGRVHDLGEETADGEIRIDLDLDARSVGWIWFEAEAAEAAAVLRDARWCVPAPPRRVASVAVAITTFNRVDDCLALIRRLAADEGLRRRLTGVVVADQGTDRLRAHADYPAVQELWGEALRVIEQDNLGGSGGFSRGMIEAQGSTATHVLLLDDDVALEPESVRRMIALAEHAEGEPLVGAQMLSLTEPTRLHSWGERVDRRRFWWGPAAPALSGIDAAAATPSTEPAMSAPCPVDFNGWWMCLIPLSAVRALGAALPLFIKWDDAEFGLRAGAAGHATVTLPGAALWHVPWTAKDDGLDWQAYFQLRNRLVAALVHSPHRRGGALLREMLALDVNHVLCLQYGSAAVRRLAVRDVLSGPAHLVPSLRSRPAQVRALLAAEGQALGEPDPAVRRPGAPAAPRGARAAGGRLLRVIIHQLRPGPTVPDGAVDAVLDRDQGKWWSLGLVDAVLLRSATGRGGFLLRRSRRRAFGHLTGALRSALTLWWRWPALARRYRAAAPGLAGEESWRSVLGMTAADASGTTSAAARPPDHRA